MQGTLDRHREGSAKGIEEVMKPHFKNYQMIWLEGRGHALHYECPDEVVHNLIDFTERVGGKVCMISWRCKAVLRLFPLELPLDLNQVWYYRLFQLDILP